MKEESIFLVIIIIMMLVLSYAAGYEMSQKKQCESNKGYYSYDFGKCFKDKTQEY